MKAVLTAMSHPRRWLAFALSGTRFDYENAVKDGMDSSVVMAPILWIAKNSVQANLEVLKETRDGQEPVANHEMLRLLRKPNPFYTGRQMQMAMLVNLCWSGDAYVIKVRSGTQPTSPVKELWFAPASMIEPYTAEQSNNFIDYYKYNPYGEQLEIMPSDVVHVRWGVNPRNTRVGISPMYPALREIYSDLEAANFTGALLHNMGIPGVILSPDSDTFTIGDPEIKETKENFVQTFRGDRRGEPMVMTGKTKVEQFGFDPEKLTLRAVRNVSEERICALLGVAAAVVGFGTGLENTKVGATMKEMREASWEDGIIPYLDVIAETYTDQLLPEFERNAENFEVKYNTSKVAALQESEDAKWKRANIGVRGGFLRVDHAQQYVGLEPDPNQAVYLRSGNIFEVAAKSIEPGDLKLLSRNGHIKAKPPRNSARLMAQFARDQRDLEPAMIKEVTKVLEDFGKQLEAAALEVLEPKQSERIVGEQILDGINLTALEGALAETFRKQYRRTAQRTANSINTVLSAQVRIPDPVAREIVATGGRRAGLVDLSASSKKRLFSELAVMQEEGIGAPAMARRIREIVPAGPWNSVEQRAKTISRTETLHAQRTSALQTYRQMDPVANVMVFDARLGTSDEECERLDGTVVTQAEAMGLADSEHPNGTRSFVIYYEEG
jgi:HK97 family phage portal protein